MAQASFPVPATAAVLQQTIAAVPGGTATVTVPSGRGYVFANLGNIVAGWVPAVATASFPNTNTAMTYYSYLCAPGNVTVYIYY
jgi:hypothetical protein